MIDFPNSPTVGQTFSSGSLSWIWDGTKWGAVSSSSVALPINFIFTAEQAMTNTEELARFIAPACSFPSGGAGSSGTAGTAATGSTTLTMAKNGSAFATFVWAGAGTAATVTMASTTSFNGTSDVLTLTGPSAADATLAKLGINLAGTRA